MRGVSREPKALRKLRAGRLKQAREAFFTEATEAAKSLRVPPPTYLGHENGSRGFAASPLAFLYAKRFDVSFAWLLGADDDPEAKAVPDRPEVLIIVQKAKKLPQDKLKAVARFMDFEASDRTR